MMGMPVLLASEFPVSAGLALACFLLPLLGFVLQWIFGHRLPRKGDWLATCAMFLAFLCAVGIGISHLRHYDPGHAIEWRFNWFSIEGDGHGVELNREAYAKIHLGQFLYEAGYIDDSGAPTAAIDIVSDRYFGYVVAAYRMNDQQQAAFRHRPEVFRRQALFKLLDDPDPDVKAAKELEFRQWLAGEPNSDSSVTHRQGAGLVFTGLQERWNANPDSRLVNRPDTLKDAFAVGIFIDNTTVIVLLMVTLLSFLIHLFATGYMKGDVRIARFFGTMNLFTAGMIGLVLSNSFIGLFVNWEIMGLCSYLLIGHYYEKKSAQKACIKAFLTTRVGDVFMFIGMMIVFHHTHTMLFTGPTDGQAWTDIGSMAWGNSTWAGPGSLFAGLGAKAFIIGGGMLSVMGLLLFIGPIGKSAQFPLHVWLPDAMEGPTPVSAMIHAACMVSAGVYLAARLFPLFTPDTLTVIAYVGGFTALFAGTIGLVQTDLKKVLAFSTISQLGFMFLGIGCGAWVPALFHLITHAFFKALMFLGAGSVILGCSHEQEMSRMGGLWRKMPITTVTFWIGALAITGAPFFFSGFYSKEAILTGANIFGGESAHILPYIFGALGAGLTTFYMFRLIWLTFHGKPKDEWVHEHAKESPWNVVLPLVVIAVFAIFVGWPIGSKPDAGENLKITYVSQFGPHDEVERPDADGRSWFFYLVNKPRSAYSREFLIEEAGYDLAATESVLRGHDGHPLYAGPPRARSEHNDPVTAAWHNLRHDTHLKVFAGSMIAFLLGLALSIFFYSPWGPFYGREWIGHVGAKHWIRDMLRRGYFLDDLYYGTVVRAQGWLMRGLTWFDQVIVDGLVNLVGWVSIKMGAGAANIDYWGVDGTVRGVHDLTGYVGRVAQKAPTGKINDYIFMLVAAMVLLFIGMVLLG